MDEREAAWIAESWSGGRGLVPRGPRWLLGHAPADPADVERHTGRRPPPGAEVWRVEVGGRFLSSGGLVYPGGVPFPEELARQTAVVTSEVWLYVDGRTSRVLGAYWWPEAVRKPVASVPRPDFDPDQVLPLEEARRVLQFELRLPAHPGWEAAAVVCPSPRSAVVILVRDLVPDPLNEMLLFEEGGLSLRVAASGGPDPAAALGARQPPYRALRVGGSPAVGREPGRPLGPQTWPWPGELHWSAWGVRYQLQGFVPLGTLEALARTVGDSPRPGFSAPPGGPSRR